MKVSNESNFALHNGSSTVADKACRIGRCEKGNKLWVPLAHETFYK